MPELKDPSSWWGGRVGLSATEVVLVPLALVFMVVALLSQHDTADVGLPAQVGLLAASWLPLVATARWPLQVLVVVVALEAVHLVAVPLEAPVEFNSIPVAVMVAAYSVAVRRAWRVAWVAGLAAALGLLAIGFLARPDSQIAANMFALDMVLAATGAGVLVRSRRHRLLALERRAGAAEQTREEEARRQVAAERLRMARELHDVVAHNLALVNAQSSVAEYLLRSDPEAAARALQDISRHTRLALDELRATVGLLRQAGDGAMAGDGDGEALRPMPGLARLQELVEAHRAAGGRITCTVEGEPESLPALSDLAAYRIAQEALTNARKHAPGTGVEVLLRWTPEELMLRVENETPVGGRGRGAGTGHGIIGMRERALAAGGTLEVSPLPGGGFAVVARIPVHHESEEPVPS